MKYDFIVVGGGSAGCVLANRLSADPSHRVLVLEAGRGDPLWDVFIHMPAALTIPIGNPRYDWCYESEPEPHLNNRRVYHARGKVLGGSSSINGMIFQRGNPMDFQRWASEPGMETWDYAHCLPYFKRMEQSATPDADFRGDRGPLSLERVPVATPLIQSFFDAAVQAGYPLTDDVNGFRQEGFALFDRNIKQGRRWSAARAYLHPVKSRQNLHVRTHAQITKLVFDGNRCVGVKVGDETIHAGRVILAAGAINTPQLLQLSGVGDPNHLAEHGIDTVVESPHVGSNLQDHLEVYIQYRCRRRESMNRYLRWYYKPWLGMQWLFLRRGAAATNHFEAGGFIRSNDDVKYPNLMFHFLPLAVRYDGSVPLAGDGYQVHIGPMVSDASGTVRLRSANPLDKPRLRFNYLSTDQDRREWIEAIRCAREILNQPAMEPYNGGEISPGAEIRTDEQILDWVRRDAETALHPSCTCAMGTGDAAVTDPTTMAIRGAENLHVVDASAMPSLTNGNIYAPVMMLAERASDLILGNTPLPPENVPFHRHSADAEPDTANF